MKSNDESAKLPEVAVGTEMTADAGGVFFAAAAVVGDDDVVDDVDGFVDVDDAKKLTS